MEAYGAFVDIALPDGRTASGLIHKSELSWSVVQIPETVVSIGAVPFPAPSNSRSINTSMHWGHALRICIDAGGIPWCIM